jgi:opacity protein-like surface antigen
MLHGLMRFQPDVRFFLQPYLQGGAGMHWFYTNTKIKDTDYGQQVESINENRDAILGFALHAGFQYVPRSMPYIRFDARFGYFRNASVEYLRYNPNLPGAVYPIEFFEPKVSAVDIFGIHLGVTMMITSNKDLFDE